MRISLHGFPDEVDPLLNLYQRQGFALCEGHPRLEMLSRQVRVNPGPRRLEFRSAEEIGLASFYEIDAMIRNWSVEDSRKNCELSRKMWSLDPRTDWLVAYEGQNLVGAVEVAVTRTGIGVLDHLRSSKSIVGEAWLVASSRADCCLLSGGRR